jgi:hypothetical protein
VRSSQAARNRFARRSECGRTDDVTKLRLCLGLIVGALLPACGSDTPATPSMMAAPVVPPTEVAARVNVRFELSGSAGFVVTRGRSCRTFEVERVGDGGFERVPLDLGNTCVCECMAPGAPLAIELAPINATTTRAFPWDGRQMVSVSRIIDCSTRSFTAHGTATELLGALQPLAPGHYRVSVAVVDTAPRSCQELMDGFWCPPDNSTVTPPRGPFALCPGRRVSTEFDLPADGNVTVRISAN